MSVAPLAITEQGDRACHCPVPFPANGDGNQQHQECGSQPAADIRPLQQGVHESADGATFTAEGKQVTQIKAMRECGKYGQVQGVKQDQGKRAQAQEGTQPAPWREEVEPQQRRKQGQYGQIMVYQPANDALITAGIGADHAIHLDGADAGQERKAQQSQPCRIQEYRAPGSGAVGAGTGAGHLR